MYKYIIKIEYDGSKFLGYATQPHGQTVQDFLENVLTRLNSQLKVKTFASSRTDSKVHAYEQYVQFSLLNEVDNLKYKLNKMLGLSINIKEVYKDFEDLINVRYDVLNKTYIYKIKTKRSPFFLDYYTYVAYDLDIIKIRNCLDVFVGEKDFTSFCNHDTHVEDKVRKVNYLKLDIIDDELIFEINGNGFLYNMVRIIIGTLINVGMGKLDKKEVENILSTKKRSSLCPVALPNGLYLKEINFKDGICLTI